MIDILHSCTAGLPQYDGSRLGSTSEINVDSLLISIVYKFTHFSFRKKYVRGPLAEGDPNGNKYVSFQDLRDPKSSINFYGTYGMGLMIIDITMTCVNLVCFFLN